MKTCEICECPEPEEKFTDPRDNWICNDCWKFHDETLVPEIDAAEAAAERGAYRSSQTSCMRP
jgi:hypothetical protein